MFGKIYDNASKTFFLWFWPTIGGTLLLLAHQFFSKIEETIQFIGYHNITIAVIFLSIYALVSGFLLKNIFLKYTKYKRLYKTHRKNSKRRLTTISKLIPLIDDETAKELGVYNMFDTPKCPQCKTPLT
jgi:hypothetical protein